jgi:hypothetical protein
MMLKNRTKFLLILAWLNNNISSYKSYYILAGAMLMGSSYFGKYQKLSARPTGGESSSGLGLSIVNELVMALKEIFQFKVKKVREQPLQ